MYIHQQTHAIFIINTVLSIRFVDNLNTNKNLFALSHLLFIITGPWNDYLLKFMYDTKILKRN